MGIFSKIAFLSCLLWPTLASAAHHVVSKDAGIDLKTDKVVYLRSIDDYGFAAFTSELAATTALPGPRVIVIESVGGVVELGEQILNILNFEKDQNDGEKIICIVDKYAYSMAFNILSQGCDVRLGTESALYMFHAQFFGFIASDSRHHLTATVLRELADEIETADKVYETANSKALHVSVKEYDTLRDQEKFWSTAELIKRGYLNGIGTITDESNLKKK